MRSTRNARFVACLAFFGVIAVACGGDGDVTAESRGSTSESSTAVDRVVTELPSDAFGIRASSDIGLGSERLLIGVGLPNGERLLASEVAATIEVYPELDPDAVQSSTAEWTWIVLNDIGLWRSRFEFDQPGLWFAQVVPENGDPLEPVVFEVSADPFAPAIGEQLPVAPTPTLDDLPLDELTTDPNPDESFYEISLEEALGNGRRSVIVFSTPAYCRTEACGPLLEHVKEIATEYNDVNFVHVEVFTDLKDPEFAPDAAHLAPSAGPEFFNLPSEPWVFIADESGVVIGRFEGVLDPTEIVEILG